MSTETSTPRAIAYCRVSTPRQAREGGCLATQARLGCRLTEQAGLQVERVTEEVSPGATLWARALLHRDRTALLDGAAAALIVASADRLARSAVDLAIVQEAAARSNARVLVADEPLPEPAERLRRASAADTGRWEREQLRPLPLHDSSHGVPPSDTRAPADTCF